MQTIFSLLGFLIHVIFDLFIFILILRIVLQWSGAHYFNPITQFTIKSTNWIVKPLQKIIPSIRRIDLAGIIVVIFVEMIQVILLGIVGVPSRPLFILLDPIQTLINIFFFAIIIRALLSWFAPQGYNPVSDVIFLITEPLLAPARKLIPNIGGVDISPIAVLIVLKLIEKIIFFSPLLP